MSRHTGEKTVKLLGKSYTVVFDWRAIAELREQLGDDALAQLQKMKPDVIAAMLVIGTQRHHKGELTADMLLDAGEGKLPPIIELTQFLDDALGRAYYGPEFVDRMKKASEKASVKKK